MPFPDRRLAAAVLLFALTLLVASLAFGVRAQPAHVDRYHHRSRSGLDYRTPLEVRRTWEDQQERRKQAA